MDAAALLHPEAIDTGRDFHWLLLWVSDPMDDAGLSSDMVEE